MLCCDMDHQRQATHKLNKFERSAPIVLSPWLFLIHLEEQQVLRFLRRQEAQLHDLGVVKLEIPCEGAIGGRVDEACVLRVGDKPLDSRRIETNAVEYQQPAFEAVEPAADNVDDIFWIAEIL